MNHDVMEHIEVDEPVDYVFHLAALASPIDYLRQPLHSLKTGSHGTHHALGLAKWKRARFLLASTSEIYGDPQVHPQPETYWGHVNPIGPRGVYDEAKRYAEALTMAYHNQQGVDTAIVRIFNTYGPRMRAHDGRAIPSFVRQALENKPLTVFGDGSQTRSFCYVDDLIRGLYLLAVSEEHLPVNLGNPSEFTILELAETVLRVTESTSEIVFEALPVDDPQIRQPDITRAKQLLGWEPEIDLEEGLRRMLPTMERVHAQAGRLRGARRDRARRPRRTGRALCAAAPELAEPDRRHLRRAGDVRRPGLGVRAVQAARGRGAARQPLLGRPERRRPRQAPGERREPERLGLRLDDLRRDGQALGRQRRQAGLLDPLDPEVGQPCQEHGAAPPDRPPQLRIRRREALQRQLSPDSRRARPARRPALDGVERAEQPGLPEAAVHEDQPAQVQAREPPDLRRHVQRRHVGRPPDRARRREGGVRRNGPAREQHRNAASGIRLTAALLARAEAGRCALRRLLAPSVLPAPQRVAAQAAARPRRAPA